MRDIMAFATVEDVRQDVSLIWTTEFQCNSTITSDQAESENGNQCEASTSRRPSNGKSTTLVWNAPACRYKNEMYIFRTNNRSSYLTFKHLLPLVIQLANLKNLRFVALIDNGSWPKPKQGSSWVVSRKHGWCSHWNCIALQIDEFLWCKNMIEQ